MSPCPVRVNKGSKSSLFLSDRDREPLRNLNLDTAVSLVVIYCEIGGIRYEKGVTMSI